MRRITMEDRESKNAMAFNDLLFATDFSAASDAALEYATSITKRYDAQLYVVHVIDLGLFGLRFSGSSSSSIKQAHEQARQKIGCMLATRGIPSEQYHIVVTDGVLPDALIDIMRQHQIDLAVLGTQGRRAFKKLLLGSVAEEVFRTAPCAVLNVGPNTAPADPGVELRHILYPVEFAPDPSDAAKYAVSIAERYRGKLTLMNVIEDVPTSANQREDFPVPVESWIEEHISKGSTLRSRLDFERGSGSVAEAVLNYATTAGVNLIVLGIQALDPVIAGRLPRSDTAYEIVSRAPCPVLTIR
ncbi:MAG TPA: universal stress protein [Candidatus Eisenbacteria bacterium]|nr:universal stress protein [Candidatus Eisenbacteria bacterium]